MKKMCCLLVAVSFIQFYSFSQTYQLEEDQRLSTSNNVSFQNISLLDASFPKIDFNGRLLFRAVNDNNLKWRYNGVNDAELLHAANFNSYVPTLTGTGATGNWNINISGIATSWGSATAALPADFSTLVHTTPDYLLAAYSGTAKAVSAAGLRSFLSIPSGGETLQSVTDRGGITSNAIVSGTGEISNILSYGNGGSVGVTGTVTNHPLALWTNSSEKVRIMPSGAVGIGTTNPLTPLHVNGGPAMTGGWNKTSTLQATYPVQIFNSNGEKWAGIGYDFSEAFRIWINATSEDVVGTGLNAFSILNNGTVNLAKGLRLGNGENLTWGGRYEDGRPTIASAPEIGILFYPAGNVSGEKLRIAPNGNVSIGTIPVDDYKLAVNGTIGSRRVKVTQELWADYVFDSSFQLAPLHLVEKYIQVNKHLPDVPSAAEVKKEGLDLGDNQAILLKKIEELTLYIIEQNKRMESLERQVKAIQDKR
jgi:hypothetical protein